jgi:multimeric flavodoxin WrbA
MRGATGEIRIPDEVREGDYDLICVGSPTWFFRPSVPIRSFLKSGAAGRLLDGKRFTAFVVCRRYGSINLRAVRKLGTNRAAWPHCGDTQVNGNHPARVIRAHPSWATMNRTSKGVARVRRRRKLRDPDQGAAE